MEVIPARVLNGLYIWLDIAFLCFLLVLLLVRKKYLAALFGAFGGLLYFIVDYGAPAHPYRRRSRPILVPALAKHQLRVYKFCLDMALARPGPPYF